MKYSVDLTRSAQADLIDLVEWIAGNDLTERDMHVLDQIQSRLESLIRHPERGAVPSELKNLRIDKYRQVFFKPYRIIYQIRGQRVVVNLIADGRRDLSVLLQRRLIGVTW